MGGRGGGSGRGRGGGGGGGAVSRDTSANLDAQISETQRLVESAIRRGDIESANEYYAEAASMYESQASAQELARMERIRKSVKESEKWYKKKTQVQEYHKKYAKAIERGDFVAANKYYADGMKIWEQLPAQYQ